MYSIPEYYVCTYCVHVCMVVVLPFIYIKIYKLAPSGPPVDLLHSLDSISTDKLVIFNSFSDTVLVCS